MDFANKAFNPECCARRHWNGGLVSEDGTQGGAQCINDPEDGGEFCAKCQKRFDASLDGKVDWHGSFSKTIQDDPGTKKDGSNHPWKLPKEKDDAEKEEKKAKMAAEKEEKKKAREEEKASKKALKEAEKLAKAEEKSAKATEKKREKEKKKKKPKAEKVAEEEDVQAPEQPKEEVEEVEEDDTDLIEIDSKQYIHDKETDTIFTKEGEPVANWVDGKPEWFADNTEDMSDEDDGPDESDESDDSDEE